MTRPDKARPNGIDRSPPDPEQSGPPQADWEATGSLLIVHHRVAPRDALRSHLEAQGYAVAVAENGHQALVRMAESSFDVVLLAVDLPGVSGQELLQRIKAHAVWSDIAAVVLAAGDQIAAVVRCLSSGADGELFEPFEPSLVHARVSVSLDRRRRRAREQVLLQQIETAQLRADKLLRVIIPIGVALSVEHDFGRLLERILLESMALCHADAGTLYLRTDDGHLKFAMLRTRSLNIAMGGTTGLAVPYPPLNLYDPATGQPNHQYVATHVAHSGESLNIPDAYATEEFDFSGPRAFDAKSGYRSTSFLVLPLKDGSDRVIGVLQLINAVDSATSRVVPFDAALRPMIEALAALAAVALGAYRREEDLRLQVQDLRIEIDEAKKARQVAEITETDYFQQLQQRARGLRSRARSRS